MPRQQPQPSIDLTNISDIDLLKATVEILLHNGPVSPQDQAELDAINQEFTRRDSLVYLPSHSRRSRVTR